MKRSLTIFLILFSATTLWAAPRALTADFSRVPLQQALQQAEREMGYTFIYNSAELDGQRLVSASFRDADIYTVLNVLLGADYSYVVKSTLVTITPAPRKKTTTRYSLPSTHYPLPTTPYTIYRDSVVAHTDTTYTLSPVSSFLTRDTSWTQPAVVQPEQPKSDATHRLMLGLGLGYGQMGYQFVPNDYFSFQQSGSLAGQLDISYAYFWNQHWGFSLGAGLDYYGGAVTVNGQKDEPYVDTDNEPCTKQTIANNLKETQCGLVLSLPVMLHYEHFFQNIGIYAAAGVRVGMPVFSRYRVASGEMIYRGWYDKWHMELDNIFDYYHDQPRSSGNLSLSKFSVAPQAEIGMLVKNWRLGIYGNAVANTMHPQSAIYNLQSAISSSHPWQVGVKATYAFRWPKKVKPLPVVYETITRTDTTWTYSERIDTVITTLYDTIQIAETLTDSPSHQFTDSPVVDQHTIFFEIDKAMPKPGTEVELDEIARELRLHSDWKIQINGHACTIGSKEYNDQLSLRRAQSVATLLSIRGVKEEQMIVRGFGYSCPSVKGEHDLSQDRRVEIKMMYGVHSSKDASRRD